MSLGERCLEPNVSVRSDERAGERRLDERRSRAQVANDELGHLHAQ